MKKLDLTITLDTWEVYQQQIEAIFKVEVEEAWATVFGVELNEAQLYQYEECAITPDELIEEMVY